MLNNNDATISEISIHSSQEVLNSEFLKPDRRTDGRTERQTEEFKRIDAQGICLKTILPKNCNNSICEVTMQLSQNNVDSKFLKP